MIRSIIATVFVFLALVHSSAFAACTGSSPTWTASADRSSINSCLSSASAGDTINVSAGTVSSGTAMDVSKGIIIVGAGEGSTTINGDAFSIDLTSDARVEISNITFSGTGGSSVAFYFPDDSGLHEDQIVIHDVTVSGYWSAVDIDYDGAHGVMYNCTLTGNEHHGYFGGYPNGVPAGHAQPPWDWDSQHYWVVEDCTIDPTDPEQIMFVTEYPFNYMIRHNNITERSSYPQIGDMHGDGDSEDNVGVAFYDNDVDLDNDGVLIEIRGGGYNLVYDNTTSGTGDPYIVLDGSCASQCDPTHDTYIWSNTGYTLDVSGNTEDVNYFLYQPGGFAELAYPHPLRSGGSSSGSAMGGMSGGGFVIQ